MNVQVDHVNEGKQTAKIGDILVTKVSLSASSAVEELVGGKFKIYFDPTYIDATKIKVPALSGVYTTTIDPEGSITISFTDPIQGGDYYAIPIEWAFKVGPTPQNFEMEIVTELLDQDNNVVMVPKDDNGELYFPTIGGYYEEPMMRKGAPAGTDAMGLAGGYRAMGEAVSTEIDGVEVPYIDPDKAQYVPFYFYIGQDMKTTTINRYIDEIVLTDTLPTYQAIENGVIVEKVAQFDAARNPGWTYDASTNTVTYVKKVYGSMNMPSLPRLNLKFPGALLFQPIENSISATLVPFNKVQGEENIVLHSDVRVIPIQSAGSNVPSGFVKYLKNGSPRTFTEWPTDKLIDFKWALTFVPGLDDIAAGRYYQNIKYTDLLLDSRMYYKSISLQDSNDVAEVIAYGDGDVEIEKGFTEDGKYNFDPANKETIKKIVVKLPPEKKLQERYIVTVISALKDPDTVFYDADNMAANGFFNGSILNADLHEPNGALVGEENLPGSDRIYIEPAKLQIRPVKTQTYPYDVPGGSAAVTGEQGTYTLSVQRTFNGELISEAEHRQPSPNFHMVDLLPPGLMILDNGIKLSPEFAASPGARYEVVPDFMGQAGQTAIVFSADVLNGDVGVVATVDTEIDLRMETGAHTNRLYMSFNEAESFNQYGLATEDHDFGEGNKPYMKTEVAFRLLKAEVMQARKYVRTADEAWTPTSDWTSQGVTTESEGKFQYMLLLDNNTLVDRLNNAIYDVLPHSGDTVTQLNNAGQRVSRGSQFENKIHGITVSGNNADQYKVEYTSDLAARKIPNGVKAEDILPTLNWSATIPENPTAFRIVPIEGQEGRLEAQEQLTIIVNMQAPVRTPAIEGKRALNSFVRNDSTLGSRFLEVNLVYNEMPPPTGDINLVKISEANSETGQEILLEGAEFTLYDASGQVVAVRTSGPDGKVTFEDVPLADYTLTETKAPEGYVANFTRQILRSDWLKNTELNFDLGKIKNPPIYNGTLLIDKFGVNDTPLQGVQFKLERTSNPRGTWYGVTDREGRLSFTGLDMGNYRLSESRSVGNLTMLTEVKTFSITYKDQVVEYTGDLGFVNDKAAVKIYKIGLLGSLDVGISLADYSAGSGNNLKEAWTYELKDESGNVREITLNTTADTIISDLVPEVLYELRELSGPADSIYLVNPTTYSFKVTVNGRLVDANGTPFFSREIYFPNEKKPMRGEAVVSKVDQDGNALAGVEFTLFRLNEETNEYEATDQVIETATDGLATFEDILPGSYEIRETLVPDGYAGMEGSFKFIVEKAPTSTMQAPVYENLPDKVVHHFSYEAVNKKLSIDFVKRQPLAEMISLVEAEELLAEYPGSVRIQRGDTPFYDVYIPLEGVTYDFYEVVDGVDVLIQGDMVTNTEGRLNLEGIANFILKPDGVYKLVETAPKDNTWVLNTRPVLIDMKAKLQDPTFTGLVSVHQNNFLKTGSVLLSKYDRYTQQRLQGVTFTLYEGTLADITLPDGTYDPTKAVEEKVTDAGGFASYKNLTLGHYVLVETKTLDEQGYYLFEEAFEFELTPDETHFFASVYNMRDIDYFDLPVTKIWFGEAPAYGEEPHEGLVINLYKDGELFESAVMKPDAEGNWGYTFERLLKKDDHGRLYNYTLEEVVPDGYEHEMVGIIGDEGVITDLEGNLLDPAVITLENYRLMNLTVTKRWDDFDNIYELRPESITLQLRQNGADLLDPVTVTPDVDGNWSHAFVDLRTHDENGVAYDYTVVETAVTGYEAPTYEENTEGITVVNSLEWTELTVQKTWVDENNALDLRPENITLQLQRNGEDFLDPVRLSADTEGAWVHTFKELPKFDLEGAEFEYTVVESRVPHYGEPEYVEETDGSITVTNTLPTIELPVIKVWSDQDDTYGLRPESITLQLQQNGENYQDAVTVTADAEGNWTHTFVGLPQFDAELNEYEYEVVETAVPHYAEPEYTVTSIGAIQVENSLAIVDLPVVKTWVDQDDAYGLRPESITLQLQQNGVDFLDAVTLTADADGNWSHTFAGLPQNDAAGTAYEYTVVEIQVPHYLAPEYLAEAGSITVTNTLPNIDLPVTKTWVDQEDMYGLRPESITLQLQQNGEDFLDAVTVTPDADGNWSHTYVGLPQIDAEGTAYVYTVVETQVPHYLAPEYLAEAGAVTVINTLPTIDLPVTKTWVDQEDKYGLRPDSITLHLQQNGEDFLDAVTVTSDADGNWAHTFIGLPQIDAEGTAYEYMVVETQVPHYLVPEYLAEAGAITVTNTLPTIDLPVTKTWEDQEDKYGLRPESITLQLQQNGVDFLDAVTVTADTDGNWTYTFVDLPQIDAEGTAYEYTIVETQVPHYSAPEYLAEAGAITVTNTLPTIDLPVTKTWVDQEDKYGLRPVSIILQLQQNGHDFLDAVTVTADADGNWTHTFVGLPQIDAEGTTYEYSVVETPVPHYSAPEYLAEAETITVTNALLTIDLPVTKTWVDQEDKYGLRPESITLQLQQNGEDFLDAVTVTADADGNWAHTFIGLPQIDAAGTAYEYTVVETQVPYYLAPEYLAEAGAITVTNTLPTTDLPVSKTWVDQEDKYGLRPESITLQLQQNGVDFLDVVTVTADANGNWAHTFVGLPQNDAEGTAYEYKIVETPVPHYLAPEYLVDAGTITVTNKLPTVDLPVTKTWTDQEDKYSLRPESITLQLQQNGVDFLDAITLTADPDGNWSYTYTELPQIDAEGTEYDYTVIETPVPHYIEPEYLIEAGTITVTNTLPTIDLPVTKTWDDLEDKLGLRPESITLQLQQNGVDFLDAVTVTANVEGLWTYTFTELPQFDAEGTAYNYTVVETQVPHYGEPEYQTSPDGFITVVNPLPVVDLPVMKTWEDVEDRHELRPVSIMLQLQQNGVDFLDPVTLTADADGNWSYTFMELPKFDAEGTAYNYTVVGTQVPHYGEPEYRTNPDGSITIINPLPTINLPITKVWVDQDDKHGLRPESITLQLQQNGENHLEPVTLTADVDGNWTYTFEGLVRFDALGTEYDYTVLEVQVPSYRTTYEVTAGQVKITNTLEDIPTEPTTEETTTEPTTEETTTEPTTAETTTEPTTVPTTRPSDPPATTTTKPQPVTQTGGQSGYLSQAIGLLFLATGLVAVWIKRRRESQG